MPLEQRPGQTVFQKLDTCLPGLLGNGNGERQEQKESAIPAGVSILQLAFLHEAWVSGVYKRIKPITASTILEYFTTDNTYYDLAKEYHVSGEAIRQRIFSGIGKMHRILYKNNPKLAEVNPYPLEQIQKGKDETQVFKTEKSKRRRGEATRSRRSPH